MLWRSWIGVISALVTCFYHNVAQANPTKVPMPPNGIITPQVMIVSMFSPEATVWYRNFPSSGLGDLLAINVSTPGLSMQYPHVHCSLDQLVCQVTTGMAEINAAATIMALTLSPKFDLGSTYWLLAGIAGVNPKYATLGSVALSRFSVQVALQYEVDAREAPQNFTTGYFPIGSYGPDEYPVSIYGTEVMELNEALRNAAYGFALNATLRDDENATFYRDRYKGKGNDKGNDDGIGSDGSEYSAALEAPSIVRCDSATSDVYFSGNLLSEAFENVTTLLTNGTGRYCMTAQEDNAVLEVLIRMTIEGRANFDRVILMRTGADFDRPPPGLSPFLHLTNGSQNGFDIAIDNIYNAGIQIVKGILRNWDCTFRKGIIPTNYVGDIFGSLGGTPDFGRGSVTGGVVVKPDGESGDLAKRQIARGRQGRPGNSLRNRREATHCHA